MSIAVVQSLTPNSANSVTSLQSNAFGMNVNGGNTILVALGYFDNTGSNPTPTLSDTSGNSYTADVNVAQAGNSNRRLLLYRCSNCTGGSSFKITATAGANSYFAIGAVEISGLTNSSPADGSGSTNSSSGSTSPSTGSWSTTNANDILIALASAISTNGYSYSATPSGFTSWGSLSGNSGITLNCEYQIVSATQSSITQSWTLATSDNWNALAFAYKSAAAAYSLTSDKSSFALSGVAATLKTARRLASATATVTLSGLPVGLRYARQLNASRYQFGLTGLAARLAAARQILSARAQFTLSGQSALLPAVRKLTAAKCAFTLTGVAADLIAAGAKTLDAALATFTLGGISARLALALKLPAARYSAIYAALSNSMRVGRRLNSASSAFTLTGQAASFFSSTPPAVTLVTLTIADEPVTALAISDV